MPIEHIQIFHDKSEMIIQAKGENGIINRIRVDRHQFKFETAIVIHARKFTAAFTIAKISDFSSDQLKQRAYYLTLEKKETVAFTGSNKMRTNKELVAYLIPFRDVEYGFRDEKFNLTIPLEKYEYANLQALPGDVVFELSEVKFEL